MELSTASRGSDKLAHPIWGRHSGRGRREGAAERHTMVHGYVSRIMVLPRLAWSLSRQVVDPQKMPRILDQHVLRRLRLARQAFLWVWVAAANRQCLLGPGIFTGRCRYPTPLLPQA